MTQFKSKLGNVFANCFFASPYLRSGGLNNSFLGFNFHKLSLKRSWFAGFALLLPFFLCFLILWVLGSKEKTLMRHQKSSTWGSPWTSLLCPFASRLPLPSPGPWIKIRNNESSSNTFCDSIKKAEGEGVLGRLLCFALLLRVFLCHLILRVLGSKEGSMRLHVGFLKFHQ